MALQRHGRIYVSARLMHDAFPDDFAMTVDERTHTIRLRRSAAFGKMLRDLERGGPSR